jgi:hypothetical protein
MKKKEVVVVWHDASEKRPAEAYVLAELARQYLIVEPCDPMPAGVLQWTILPKPIEADGLTSCVDDD